MRTLIIICCVLFSLNTSAQLKKANIKELKFISGKWFTQHQWGDMEENWSEPVGNNMMCSYRCVKDGKAVFYEFIIIEQSDSVPVMKLRHFGAGNIAWEEKDKPFEYPLVSIEKDKATFERPDKKLKLIFFRRSPTQLQVSLEREEENKKWVKDVFEYNLQ